MPLKLNIAMSRKIGEPNYSSRGATVGLEMEVDSSLVNQPQQLQERIARLFRLAKVSVDRELRMHGPGASQHPSVRPATANQIRAIHAIANRRQIDLAAELRSLFDANVPEELTLSEASELIDLMKPATNGQASE